jgi:hypothetical protein
MSWYRVALICAGTAAACLIAIFAHGQLMCGDDLTGVLLLFFLVAVVASAVCAMIGVIQAIRATQRNKTAKS